MEVLLNWTRRVVGFLSCCLEEKKWVLSTGCCGKKGKAFLVYFLFFPIFKALLPFCERTVSLVNLENVRAYEEQPLKFVPERLSRFGICLFVFPGRKKWVNWWKFNSLVSVERKCVKRASGGLNYGEETWMAATCTYLSGLDCAFPISQLISVDNCFPIWSFLSFWSLHLWFILETSWVVKY